MNGVLGAAALLQKMRLDNGVGEYIDIIQDCGKSLMSILNDILDVSKLEVGKFDLEQSEVRISEILRAIRSIYNVKAQEKGIEFDASVDGDVVDCRLGDSHRLMQIMHNVVSNAMKFTERGSVKVKIANAVSKIDGQPTISISVVDTGIGMSREQLDTIFDAFVQADSSTTRRYGGSGLGLSIVKGIVDAMKGKIIVNSVPDEGTTFRINIPLPTATAAEEAASASQGEGTIAWKDISILVAEDNGINKMIVDAFLKQTGARVIYVENGRDAVEAVKRSQFDIILMDVHMPVMDGMEALKEIRFIEESEARKPAPIIAVTADAMQQERRKYLEFGFSDHLPKPINEDGLLNSIEKNLAEYSQKIRAA